ncbi:MAG: TIGR03936 family radical SAM-associated protein [Clostridiales Family XIII bacterium]|jgi:radical SAM-linked protein|nr:TIGR03936 family radical SAM-associated protein [Clostridiales Family XIII bacterium]
MKYVIRFEKTDLMVFISHLDLQRLLLRALRMAGYRPAYSHGFNPHPKLSIALPLPLGFSSSCELMEVELEVGLPGGDAKGARSAAQKLNEILPDGLNILSVEEKDERVSRSYSALVTGAAYEILAKELPDLEDSVAVFLSQEQILAPKKIKKTGKIEQVDIKPLIQEFRVEKKWGLMTQFACRVAAGAKSLNPLTLLEAFYAHAGLPYNPAEITVRRTQIFFD